MTRGPPQRATSLPRASGVFAITRWSNGRSPGLRIATAIVSLCTSSPRWVMLSMAGSSPCVAPSAMFADNPRYTRMDWPSHNDYRSGAIRLDSEARAHQGLVRPSRSIPWWRVCHRNVTKMAFFGCRRGSTERYRTQEVPANRRRGGIRTPGTSKRHNGFRDRCILSHAFPADLNEAHASRAFPRVFNCPRSPSGRTRAHLGVEMAQEWHNRTAESVADRAFPGAGREARVVAVSEADGQSAATHTMARSCCFAHSVGSEKPFK